MYLFMFYNCWDPINMFQLKSIIEQKVGFFYVKGTEVLVDFY